eukprot:TRINITY_DN3664_c0_g1_i2.p1 TRINITY_DN3664_c0_g1~~TRINITY_DN3664_c0_g1_i2.p1  ORF type:complete len:579 (-),score=198.70 TRINITY_DN3664_c0_g1_i2:828-2564(-)
MSEHHHRSSQLPNKSFKGRNAGHKSKREIDRKTSGKVSSSNIERGNIKNRKGNHTKQDLRNTKKQIIKNRRDVMISHKRGIGAEPTPKLVALINLGGEKVNMSEARSNLLDYLAEGSEYEKMGPVTMRSKKYKTRFTIFQTSEEIYCMMDIAKIADIIIFVVSEESITPEGKKVISILKAQGIGSVFVVTQGVNYINDSKRQKLVQKQILQEFQHEFPNVTRILPLDKKEDADQVIRFLDVLTPSDTEWRKDRSYLLADKHNFIKANKPTGAFQSIGDEEKGTLVVSGYLKGGAKMNANLLVHLPYFGDFQLIKIVSANDPCSKEKMGGNKMIEEETNEERILHQFNPEERDNLEFENIPDPLDGDQNWPEEQDLKDDSFEDIENAATKLKKKKVPKGTSTYQTTWIPDTESSEGDSDSESNEGDNEKSNLKFNSTNKNKITSNQKQLINEKEDREDYSDDEEEDDDESGMEDEGKKPRNTIRFDGEAQHIDSSSEEEVKMSIQESHFSIRIKDRSNHTLEELENEQLDWPDEVEAPVNQRASIRFQKYRGLKSYRTSSWDPKVFYIFIFYFCFFFTF